MGAQPFRVQPPLIVWMSLRLAIPWRVALQQCPPPLHRLPSDCDKLALPVNRYGDNSNIADPVNFNRLPEPLAA